MRPTITFQSKFCESDNQFQIGISTIKLHIETAKIEKIGIQECTTVYVTIPCILSLHYLERGIQYSCNMQPETSSHNIFWKMVYCIVAIILQ